MKKPVHFCLNGRPVILETEANRTLVWILRGDLQLTGTKHGCGIGACGACTVVVGGKAARSCQVTLSDVEGKDVVTVEGLAREGALHPLQQAFIDHGALQCGYCTPGMLMNAYALLGASPRPAPEAIEKAMEDNLCRCGAYARIIAAISAVAREGGRP